MGLKSELEFVHRTIRRRCRIRIDLYKYLEHFPDKPWAGFSRTRGSLIP
jgi:hypothetical protein